MGNPIKREGINLIGNLRAKKATEEYKGEYNRLFPAKMSSSAFLTLFTLFTLKTKNEPTIGYEILNEISEMLDSSIWKPSHGTLYPLLSKLEKQGLVNVTKITKTKKFYEITYAGKQYLEEQMGPFKAMLASSSNFFSSIMTRMYPENKTVPDVNTHTKEAGLINQDDNFQGAEDFVKNNKKIREPNWGE